MRLEVFGSSLTGPLFILVLLLKILIIEVSVQIMLIIHPSTDLVRVFLVKVTCSGLSVYQHVLAIVANVISVKSVIAPQHHLAPKIGMCSTLMHGSVRLKALLNEVLILA